MKIPIRLVSVFAVLGALSFLILPNDLFSGTRDRVKTHSTGSTLYVTVNKLNFRDQPSVQGKLLGQFLLSEQVSVIKTGATIELIGKQRGRWYFVVSKSRPGERGWVFGAFLSERPVKSENETRQMVDGHYIEFYLRILIYYIQRLMHNASFKCHYRRDGFDSAVPPFRPLNRTTRLSVRLSPPTLSHGTQTLYECPRLESL